MKKIYILSATCFLLTAKMQSQCSSCTTTINGNDGANHIVSAGQTLCITSSGTASGLITVSGGTLCNQGTINSTNLWVQSGAFHNYGSVTTANVLTSTGGGFYNYGSATIDSLLIDGTNSQFQNQGTLTNLTFKISSGAMSTNTGTITCNYLWDSAGTLVNSGNVMVNVDFSNQQSSHFQNNAYMNIGHDFLNDGSSTFGTNCMVGIGHDWLNMGTISGPAGTCGGFTISGSSGNYGTIGTSIQHLDICDTGNPPGGLDAPFGTIASTTTYCTCANACNATGIPLGKDAVIFLKSIYPNPAADNIAIELNNRDTDRFNVEITDMLGRKQLSRELRMNKDENKILLDLSELGEGIYLLNVNGTKKVFAVAR